MIRHFELIENVKAYDLSADEDALNRAYIFSMKAHGHQKRASGDPYFSHPLEVAGILTDYKLDTQSIITALLQIWVLIWVGLALLVLGYLLFFISPRNISIEKRWRGESIEDVPDSPWGRFKRWINS